jgi:hypothetical protein
MLKKWKKKILNDISPKIMEKLNQARNSLSATSYANLNIGNELKGLEEEDISVFAGIINYYEYYMWLKLLRQPQKWWTGSCERLGKTIMWYFIGIIFCICFGFPMWLLYVISGFISNSKLTSQEVGHLLSCGICCGGVESEVTLVSRCILTSKSSTRDSFTFSCYRSPTYYFPGTFGVFWNLARLISGAFSVQLMPDGAILASLLSGPTSRDLIVEFDNGDKLSANSDALQINQEIWNKFMSDEKIKKEIKQRFKEIKEEHDEFRKQHKIDSKDDEIDDKNFFI